MIVVATRSHEITWKMDGPRENILSARRKNLSSQFAIQERRIRHTALILGPSPHRVRKPLEELRVHQERTELLVGETHHAVEDVHQRQLDPVHEDTGVHPVTIEPVPELQDVLVHRNRIAEQVGQEIRRTNREFMLTEFGHQQIATNGSNQKLVFFAAFHRFVNKLLSVHGDFTH